MSHPITPERLQAYRLAAREEDARRRRHLERRRQRALEAARAAATYLRQEAGARRVLLFGSVASGHGFHERSDIDLAVEGLPPEGFWRASIHAERAAHPFALDLIDMEDASPGLRAHLEAQGVELP